MNNFFYKFIFVCILYSTAANAQYDEYFRFTDVRGTIVYDFAMRSVINDDVKIIKRNNIRLVLITDESGAPVKKIGFDKEGRITNFSSYEYNEGEEINYEIQWSEDSKFQKIFYKEFGKTAMSFEYDFFYSDNFLERISTQFGFGLSEDYIFTFGRSSGDNSIEKISFKDNYKDTVYMEQLFNYNSNGKLESVYDAKFAAILDSVYYDGNNIGINTKHFKKRKFEIENNRIIKEINIYPSKQLSAKHYTYETEIPDITSTVNYFYKDNGLIDYTATERGEISLKSFYTYEYYD